MPDRHPFTVRPARPNDVESMAALLAELFAVETDFCADRSAQRRGLRLLLETPERAAVLVAEAGQAVEGMVTVQVLTSTAAGGPVGLVEDLVVADGRRGGGVGGSLLGAAEAWARERGLLRLQLLADRGNRGGLEFYRNRRWRRTQLVCLRREGWSLE